jgi:crotonobetaine/carnitine-CoA ligase
MLWKDYLARQETFPQIVERRAAATPDETFMSSVAGESVTWAQFEAAGRAWAARAISLGVGRGDVVNTLIDSGVQATAIWLGLSKIGAVDAAISSEFRGRMLAHAINNCAPKLLITKAEYLPQLEQVAGELQTIEHILVIGEAPDKPLASTLPGVASLSDADADVPNLESHFAPPQWCDLACISHTSGTTGPSKAVMMPWGQLHSIVTGTWPLEDLNAADVMYGFSAHAHFGSKSGAYLTALVGGRLVIRPRFSASHFWDDVERFGVTTTGLVGTIADMLLRHTEGPAKTTLRNLVITPLSPTYHRFNERFGTRVCTVYNSTENGCAVFSGWNPSNPRSVGKLRTGYPGFEVRIVDEHDYEVPDGTAGEFVVRSSVPWTMSTGYLNNPEATAKAWRNGWFHTGDVFVRDANGDYMFVDRLKDAIRRRGENISSHEVETDVRANPEIAECAAVATQNPLGEEEILLFAVRRAGSSITPAMLWSDLKTRMPRFMVPRYIEFVDALPKTEATARVVKAQLRQRGIGPETWDRERATTVG